MDRLPALALFALLVGGGAEAATVSGSVVSYPDGAPLAGVQVLVRDAQGRSAATVTGDDGIFAAVDVDPGQARIQAVPPMTMNRIGAYVGDVSSFCAAPTVRLDPDTAHDGVRIELPEGGRIRGTVLPAAGEITAEGADTLNLSLRRTAAVDAAGAFDLAGLASWVSDGAVLPGAYRVSATDGAGGRYWYPGTWDRDAAELVPAVRGEVTPISFSRPPGADLVRCLVDPDGAPWEGATLTVRASEGSFAATTDAAGCFLLGDLPGASWTVVVDSPGLAVTTIGPELPDPLVVPPEATLLLDVAVDQIALVPPGADGPLLLRATSGLRAERLPPGDWDVLVPAVRTAEWRPVRVPVTLESGEQTAVSVDLEPAGTIEIATLRRADLFGLRGARVEALDSSTAELITSTTSVAGIARLIGLPLRSVILVARWEPFCPSDPGLVPVWSGGARAEPLAAALTPRPDADVDGPLFTVLMPPDRDGDAMDDVWELVMGGAIDRHDAADDPDGDGRDNLTEYREHTDPRAGGDRGCSAAGSTPTCRLPLLAVLVGVIVRRRPRGYHPPPASPGR